MFAYHLTGRSHSNCSERSVKDCDPQGIYVFTAYAEAPSALLSLALSQAFSPISIGIVIPHRDPPAFRAREDADVDTMIVCGEILHKLITPELALSKITPFKLVAAAIQNNSVVARISVLTTSMTKRCNERSDQLAHLGCTTLVPHRGNVQDLHRCLSYLAVAEDLSQHAVAVGLDEWTNSSLDLVATPLTVKAWASRRRVGPYSIRNFLARNATTPILAFQDSDDIPLINRISVLTTYLYNNKCDVLGSHELRLDFMQQRLFPVRYPLNVNSALESDPFHAILLCTACIDRNAFEQSGGFSDNELHSLDTQFTYRAVFKGLKIRNIDCFLYLRVVHSGSLTTSAETGFRSVRRKELWRQWREDYNRICNRRSDTVSLGSLELNRSDQFEFSEII